MHSLGCQQFTEIQAAEGGLLACLMEKVKIGNTLNFVDFHYEKYFISSKKHIKSIDTVEG